MQESQKLKLLIVDDCRELTGLLQLFLAHPAIESVVANESERCLDLFRRNDFDLVLLDIEMPGLDGYAIVKQIRDFERQQRRARTPVMALTAQSDINASHLILSSGFDHHLVKPISRVTLLQIVGQFRRSAMKKTNYALEDSALEGLGDQLPAFLERRSQDLMSLQRAIRNQDHGTVRSVTASLESVASSLGFDSLRRLAETIQKAGSDPAALAASVDHYQSYVETLRMKTDASFGIARRS